MAKIRAAVAQVPTRHRLLLGDARRAALPAESVHLVLTSPPYWTLKEYRRAEGQLGWVADYDEFLDQLDRVWRMCHGRWCPADGSSASSVTSVYPGAGTVAGIPWFRCMRPSRSAAGHSGSTILAPIIWHKIANAAHEVERGTGGFLGKPYEPNAVIKNDVEFILMQRKAGGYRRPSRAARTLSLLSEASFKTMFRQVWTDIAGASTRDHPAPYPVALADRLIRMFSFVGDTVLDPFTGTASTQVAAAACGRNTLGIEVDPVYYGKALARLRNETASLLRSADVSTGEIDREQRLSATA